VGCSLTARACFAGALNNLNLGSLTPAQLTQIVNGRGGAGQLQDAATQEQYFRLFLQQQQQERDKNALQVGIRVVDSTLICGSWRLAMVISAADMVGLWQFLADFAMVLRTKGS
jgi:hypothetical protein